MINNDKVTCTSITEAYRRNCRDSVKMSGSRHVLCIQDTCEVNYEAHSLRMRKKGRKPGCVSNEEAGCFLHPSFVIDAETYAPYGFSYIKVWNREEGKANCRERSYKKLPPEQKESFRWSEAIDSTRELLGGEPAVTMLSDRESDVYEVLKRGEADVKIVIRSKENRRIKNCSKKLHDMIRELPSFGTYDFQLPASHGRKTRTVKMHVRFAPVELECPAGTYTDAHVRLNCICVSEDAETVPHGGKPLEWILLTNHEVNTMEQALQCVCWYRCRWFIEELFRLLKRKGFTIEDIQLENTECIEKDILLAAYAAMRCILLKQAFDHPDFYRRVPAQTCFSNDETEAARLLETRLRGRTTKQQNPYEYGSLAWLSWIIARLGCWSGYITQSRPGYTTFKSGLDKLNENCRMYRIMKDMYKG